jgi:trigger factor
VTVAFPADFAPVPALAGRNAVYAVEVQEVRERVLPPLDAEFFKAQQVDDLAGLQAQIRTNLRIRKEQENRAAQRSQVTQALADRAGFEQTQSVLRQFIEENMRRGVPAEQFERDKQSLYEGARKAAASRVKVQFILAKIAEAEKIEVVERDFDGFIRREAARSGQSPDKVAKQLGKDRDALRSAQQSIIFDKAVDFLVSKATVSETTT